ncbi:MAG: PEGA domain-containing protein, partial [Methanoregula sp.]|nr:PEGA domain-containing protein [Methanoregula sp.]
GTSVVLDGEYRGTSPLTLEGLKPGTYNVTFSRFGYTQQTLPVTVEAGMRAEIDVTLIPVTGSLRIATSPGGGRIILDGADAGISPVTLTKIPAGNHTITAAKEGYAPEEQTVWVIAGQTVTADLVLEPAVPAHATQRAGGLIPSIIPAVFVFLLFLIICRPRFLR